MATKKNMGTKKVTPPKVKDLKAKKKITGGSTKLPKLSDPPQPD
jgi:hypothetical protein